MSRRTAARHASPRGRSRPAAVAASVGIAAILVTSLVDGVVTSAAYGDRAYLDVASAGVGSSTPFAVVVVDESGIVHSAPADGPLVVPVPGADALVPGRTVRVPLRAANNHPTIAADVVVTVTADPVPGTPDITPFLRYSVVDADGRALVGGTEETPGAGVASPPTVDLGVLTAHGAPPVPDGAPWESSVDGASLGVTLLVHMVDDPATEASNGGQVRLGVLVDGTSAES